MFFKGTVYREFKSQVLGPGTFMSQGLFFVTAYISGPIYFCPDTLTNTNPPAVDPLFSGLSIVTPNLKNLLE